MRQLCLLNCPVKGGTDWFCSHVNQTMSSAQNVSDMMCLMMSLYL